MSRPPKVPASKKRRKPDEQVLMIFPPDRGNPLCLGSSPAGLPSTQSPIFLGLAQSENVLLWAACCTGAQTSVISAILHGRHTETEQFIQTGIEPNRGDTET